MTDLAERTGLPKSTVSRLLSSLDVERAVRQNDDGIYELGDGIAELGLALRDGQNAIDVARPHMAELLELTGEAVGLNRFDGVAVRTLLQIDDPNSSVTVRDWTDIVTPAHAVPAGLAALAFSSKATQRSFLSGELPALTDKTMTDPDELLERFAQIREDGYVWVNQEFTEDINSVAAPIADSSGRTSLALHVHGPSFRFPAQANTAEIGERVAATAQRIESQLATG